MSIRRVQQYNHTIPVYSKTKKLRLELVSVFSLLCFLCFGYVFNFFCFMQEVSMV